MNVLITGARAPIAADLARACALAGHRVWTADSLRWPVGAASPFIVGSLRMPAPRANPAAFTAALSAACRELRLDAIIPTSEEVFWLAAGAPRLPRTVRVCTSTPATLARLHDKIRFAALATELGYGAPESRAIASREDLDAITRPEDFVLKPAFSRFATRTLIGPTRARLRAILPSAEQPWLAQTRLKGREFCLYNVADRGRLLLHVAYEPALRHGLGASLCFRPVHHAGLRALAARFIAATEFTGQISFDAMADAGRLVALECNPRGTSGVHLAAQQPAALAAALLEGAATPAVLAAPSALKLPILLGQPRAYLRGESRALLRSARDAQAEAGISAFAQLRALGELSWRALRSGRGLAAASTADIEWNGEPLHG